MDNLLVRRVYPMLLTLETLSYHLLLIGIVIPGHLQITEQTTPKAPFFSKVDISYIYDRRCGL